MRKRKKKLNQNLIYDFKSIDGKEYSITREYEYEASNQKSENSLWNLEVYTKEGKKKPIKIDSKNELSQNTIKEIGKHLPAICYFPTFAFQIPERIFLDSSKINSEKDKKVNEYFNTILQDILDSSIPNSTLNKHILDRMIIQTTRQIQ